MKILKSMNTMLTVAVIAMAAMIPVESQAASSTNANKDITTGSGNFDFSFGDDQKIDVYYHLPENQDKTLPVLFVMHGTNRDADRYRDEWAKIAEEQQILVVVPQFSKDDYPRAAGYNLGNIFNTETGERNSLGVSPFGAIEPLFDYVREQVPNTQDSYSMYGHSAGSQFVHRYIYFVPEARLDWAIAANAGWYTMPDLDVEWPYGLAGTGLDEADLQKALASRLYILLGTKDNNPDHKSLRKTEEAMAQGPHRFARGQTFFEAGKEAAGSDAFGWSMGFVDGAAHRNREMIQGVLPIIQGNSPDIK